MTKIHAMTDLLGRPVALLLTPGNVCDISATPAVISKSASVQALMADKDYDADTLRKLLPAQRARPVIPCRRNRNKAIRYGRDKYKERWCVEAVFCWIATRFDKLVRNFLSVVMLATIVALWSD